MKQECALNPRILNLMQLARKAGKLEAGSEACIRAMHHGHIHTIVVASDAAQRSKDRIKHELEKTGKAIVFIDGGTKEEISLALGLPNTGIFGICDKNFAAGIAKHYFGDVEEPCK